MDLGSRLGVVENDSPIAGTLGHSLPLISRGFPDLPHPRYALFIYTYKVCLEKVQPLLIYENSLCDINVTWQPRRVDWNMHV